ncbi:iron-containing alcohol dehydrogenase family protein [Candidatus Leptofilum sp.]|uniref:iron-containing alcohol dehydrogenase family protein n=1 Tax=Candidatus Leptofilum sp. TaxID=3241576 RepID=UPI003B595214
MSPIATYYWPGQTHFGFGAAQRVGDEAKALGVQQRVFLVTDSGIVAAGLLQTVLDALDMAGLETAVFDQTPPNPNTTAVDAAAAQFRDSGAELVIGLGGGSPIDAAKAVRILAGGPPDAKIAEYALMLGDKVRPLPTVTQMPPMIAIPTTAGTGAEVTPWGLITDPARKLKMGVGGPATIPTVALIDPAMTLPLPPHLTAATGMDALTHLIEAYVSTNTAPIALDALIVDGLGRIGRFLRLAVAQPAHQQAREEVMLASMLGGIAISSRWLGAAHSLAHQLSGIADVHHGLACALMLPAQMQFSLPGALERYANVAQALEPCPVVGSVREEAERGITAVRQLMRDTNLPLRLRDVGVTEEMIPILADNAVIDLNWTTNPRAITRDQMETLYRETF